MAVLRKDMLLNAYRTLGMLKIATLLSFLLFVCVSVGVVPH